MVSCHRDVKNVSVSGAIIDANKKKPIKDANVTIICWSYGDSPDQSYTKEEKIEVKSNSSGEFSGSFETGAFIEIKVSAEGYIDVHEPKEIFSSKNSVNIKLNLN